MIGDGSARHPSEQGRPSTNGVNTTSVLIADPRPINGSGLAQAISRTRGLRVCGCCRNAREIQRSLTDSQPDIVVLDPELFRDPRHAVSAVRVLQPELPILLTVSRNDDAIPRDVDNNVACVSAYSNAEQLIGAVHALAGSQPTLADKINAVHDRTIASNSKLTGHRLTTREQQTLELAANGLTIQAIGRTLHVSHSTAKAHLCSVYRKLGVPNRSAAIATAIRDGLLSPNATADHPQHSHHFRSDTGDHPRTQEESD